MIYIDGASKGNPGEAGAGVWMTDGEGRKVFEMGRYLGHKTNNEAEYWALLLGLREARRLGGRSIRIFTDSELVERQVNGIYRVKNPNLKVLHSGRDPAFKGVFILCHRSRSRGRRIGKQTDWPIEAIQRGIARKERRRGDRRGTDGRSS